MPDISAAAVKTLRDETNVGIMECKRALIDANGDNTKAIKILRERGMAVAQKRANKATDQGIIASAVLEEGRVGSLIEVNCETDFVAKNETFKAFVRTLAEKAARMEGSLADEANPEVTAKIAEIGENIVVRRNIRYALQENGLIVSYIHHGSMIGMLAEMGCQKSETVSNCAFIELAKDICLHIAASNPHYIDRSAVPPEIIAAERDICAKQVQDKPPQIIEKIVDGKMNKYYAQACLVDQPFVKDQDKTIAALLKEKGVELDDTVALRRFTRFQVGDSV
ncbi:translation elongation factor Ts [Verrucomicrobiota bacterium]